MDVPFYRVRFFGRAKCGNGLSHEVSCRKIIDVWAPTSGEAIDEALRRHNLNGDWLDVSRIEIMPDPSEESNRKGRML